MGHRGAHGSGCREVPRPGRGERGEDRGQELFGESLFHELGGKFEAEDNVEQTVATPGSQFQEKLVEVILRILQEHEMSERIVERFIGVPVLQVQEVDVPVIMQAEVPTVQDAQTTVEVPTITNENGWMLVAV